MRWFELAFSDQLRVPILFLLLAAIAQQNNRFVSASPKRVGRRPSRKHRRRWNGNPKVLHALNRASERLERREDKENEYLKA